MSTMTEAVEATLAHLEIARLKADLDQKHAQLVDVADRLRASKVDLEQSAAVTKQLAEERDAARDRWEKAERDEHGHGCQCVVCAMRDGWDQTCAERDAEHHLGTVLATELKAEKLAHHEIRQSLGFECTRPDPKSGGPDASACHCCQRRFLRLEGSADWLEGSAD